MMFSYLIWVHRMNLDVSHSFLVHEMVWGALRLVLQNSGRILLTSILVLCLPLFKGFLLLLLSNCELMISLWFLYSLYSILAGCICLEMLLFPLFFPILWSIIFQNIPQWFTGFLWCPWRFLIFSLYFYWLWVFSFLLFVGSILFMFSKYQHFVSSFFNFLFWFDWFLFWS